jgi:signal transduction histidine kinase
MDRVPHGWEHTLPDGSVLQVRFEHLANGSSVFSWTDVTEARRVATALTNARNASEASRSELVATFEEAPFGIALMSSDRRLEFMNPIAVAMLDLPAEFVRPGTKGGDILRFQIERGDLAATPKLVAAANRALLHPSEERGTYERLTRDGRMIEVRISTLPEGRMIRTYADISYRHAALREHARAREAAEAVLRSRTEFIASASQELRTPINAINRLVETLLSQDSTSSQAADLRLMQEAGRRLSSLVDDILDVALLERGRLNLTRKAFAPSTMLEGAAALILPQAEAQGLGFDVCLDPALPALALGDEERLRQVVVKLLENAVKFTWAGSVKLSADLLAEDDMGWLLGIAVTDTGVGISPPAQGELFEPFFQADSSRSRRYDGAGLGLAVCRMLLEAMGGSISVYSEEGCGSTFRCKVPLRQISTTAALSAASGQVAGHPA